MQNEQSFFGEEGREKDAGEASLERSERSERSGSEASPVIGASPGDPSLIWYPHTRVHYQGQFKRRHSQFTYVVALERIDGPPCPCQSEPPPGANVPSPGVFPFPWK